MVVCLARNNVHPESAHNALYEDVAGERVVMQPRTLPEAHAVFWTDNKIYHEVSDISPQSKEDGPAVRTVMLLHADAGFVLDGLKNRNNTLPGRNAK